MAATTKQEGRSMSIERAIVLVILVALALVVLSYATERI